MNCSNKRVRASGYIVSPSEQQAEIDNLRKKEADTNRELRQVDKTRRHDIVSLERHIEVLNIAVMPLAVILAGISLAAYKHKRNSAT